MKRVGMVALSAAFGAVPLVGASCGEDSDSGATLPPIVTTTVTTLPAVTTTQVMPYYIVQTGDMLGNIAREFGVSMDELMRVNGITNPNLIEVGQALAIPPSTMLVTLPANT